MVEPVYRIDVEEREFVVRVRRDVLDRVEIERFLDVLELESIRRRSKLAREDVASCRDEINESVRERRARLEAACAMLDPAEERALAEGRGEHDRR
jgi:hypothetical protein